MIVFFRNIVIIIIIISTDWYLFCRSVGERSQPNTLRMYSKYLFSSSVRIPTFVGILKMFVTQITQCILNTFQIHFFLVGICIFFNYLDCL